MVTFSIYIWLTSYYHADPYMIWSLYILHSVDFTVFCVFECHLEGNVKSPSYMPFVWG